MLYHFQQTPLLEVVIHTKQGGMMNIGSPTINRYIGFRVLAERDEDILDWWNTIPNGERSHILRSLIRAYLCGEVILTPEGEKPTEFSRNLQLAQLQAEALWIKNSLKDLPEYLENLIGGLKVVQAQSSPAVPALAETNSQPITSQGVEQRAQQISKRGW
jgi:hypothetical protein